jgi:hypothetical protein
MYLAACESYGYYSNTLCVNSFDVLCESWRHFVEEKYEGTSSLCSEPCLQNIYGEGNRSDFVHCTFIDIDVRAVHHILPLPSN